MFWGARSLHCLSTRAVAAGAFTWPHDPSTLTLVVKQTYRMSAEGIAALSSEQDSLCLHRFGEHGELIYPSDFSPFKPQCDIVIVSPGTPEGSLRVAASRHHIAVAAPAPLARPAALDPAGAPLDDDDDAVSWGTADFDFRQFQVSVETLRISYPELPFGLRIRGADRKHDTAVVGPSPDVAIFDAAGEMDVVAFPLHCDTIIADLGTQRCHLVFRAILRGHGKIARDPVIVIDQGGEAARRAAEEVLAWPRHPLVHPSMLRVWSDHRGAADGPWDERTQGLVEEVTAGALDLDEETAVRLPWEEAPGASMKVEVETLHLSERPEGFPGALPFAARALPESPQAQAASSARVGRETLPLEEGAELRSRLMPFLTAEKPGRQTLASSPRPQAPGDALPFRPSDRPAAGADEQTVELELPPALAAELREADRWEPLVPLCEEMTGEVDVGALHAAMALPFGETRREPPPPGRFATFDAPETASVETGYRVVTKELALPADRSSVGMAELVAIRLSLWDEDRRRSSTASLTAAMGLTELDWEIEEARAVRNLDADLLRGNLEDLDRLIDAFRLRRV